ncbi:hypothetical protein O6H91_03G111600 [Diphasiastrum complanatum]|uniref:Uncharacterized protein n=1 Tax=Diphasiastrum complanatum TaxID=34168 RepID=A0ACC2EAF0_DIPCM|nr:hypothetical protein O6H91_03G111600 [Diphasiastrum complanatum]
MEILRVSNAAGPSLAPLAAAAKASCRSSGFVFASQKNSSFSSVERIEEAIRGRKQLQSNLPAAGSISHTTAAVAWFLGGLVSPQAGLALNYDEIVQSVNVPRDVSLDLNVDFGGAFGSVLDIVSVNPLAVIGGALAIALPLALSSLLGKPQPWGTVSAKDAYAKIGDPELNAQLLDIRDPNDMKLEGTPDLRAFKKRVVQVAFGEDESGFIEKVSKKFKDPATTSVYILDRFDGDAPAVAKLLATNGFKAAYAIKDGAEGPNGWQKSELPWLLPRKGFTFNVEALKDVLDLENTSVVPATLGVAAAAGVGLLVFSEAETALQLLGTAAVVQLFVKKLLFAETLKELQTFLDTKVAPKELVDELKGIGKAFLPKLREVSYEAAGNGAAISQNVEAQVPTSEIVEAAAPSGSSEIAVVPTIDAVQNTEEKSLSSVTPAVSISTDLPRSSTPLSPYPRYADLKPPSSPTPSRP